MRKICFSKHSAAESKVFITGILKSFQFTNLPATYLHFVQIFLTPVNTTRNETKKYIYRDGNLVHCQYIADYTVYNTVNLDVRGSVHHSTIHAKQKFNKI